MKVNGVVSQHLTFHNVDRVERVKILHLAFINGTLQVNTFVFMAYGVEKNQRSGKCQGLRCNPIYAQH